MFKFEMQGIDELKRKLDVFAANARELHGEHQLPITELLTDDFMHRHTKYGSFQAMVDQSPFRVESSTDFEAIPDAEWDTYVQVNTSFAGWQAMLEEAGKEYVQKKLFA